MNEYIENLILRFPMLESIEPEISKAYGILLASVSAGGKILVCGNGGSSADADHIVGELMKSFCRKRPIDDALQHRLIAIDAKRGGILAQGLEGTIPAINLTQHTALTTAYSNDRYPALAFSQQLLGYGNPGDTLIALSTSGNSENVILACITAKAKGLRVVALTGASPALLDQYCDVVIKVPETETYKIQELHLPVYHCLCLALEVAFWKNAD
ncbi:MAG: D-sedoheptulose-7-phosphate isomerase [Sphaerochaetaceae bacterium]|jgi:D-sedoheptulose 7-phosphate isomerase